MSYNELARTNSTGESRNFHNKGAIRRGCNDLGHDMTPFLSIWNGQKSTCRKCGLTAHYNENTGKSWGDAIEVECKT